MRILIAVTLLGFSSALAQQPGQMPDSTYLRLTLDLPGEATFTYDSISRQRRVTFLQTVKNVRVAACSLSLTVQVQRSSIGADSRFARPSSSTSVALALDALDTTRLRPRPELPSGISRLEPHPWLLRAAVRRNKAQIVLINSETSHKHAVPWFDFRLKDVESAE